jgi:uncharacterized protein YukE
MTLIVTPEVLRTTQQAIETALQHAASIANGYLSSHEGIGSAVWGGQAQLASVNTAGQINLELQQMITGGTRLAHGLSQAASMIESQEGDSARSLTAFAAMA